MLESSPSELLGRSHSIVKLARTAISLAILRCVRQVRHHIRLLSCKLLFVSRRWPKGQRYHRSFCVFSSFCAALGNRLCLKEEIRVSGYWPSARFAIDSVVWLIV